MIIMEIERVAMINSAPDGSKPGILYTEKVYIYIYIYIYTYVQVLIT